MGKGFEDGGETDDWSSRAYGPKREEHSRFKGVCYSTSLAGVNDYGATNKRSADSPSRRAILLRFDPVLTVVTSKTQRMREGDMVPSFPPSSAVDKVYTVHFTHPNDHSRTRLLS